MVGALQMHAMPARACVYSVVVCVRACVGEENDIIVISLGLSYRTKSMGFLCVFNDFG